MTPDIKEGLEKVADLQLVKIFPTSVHRHKIQINQPNRCNNFPDSLLYVYVQLNMFRASSRPSSGAQQLLSFYRWRVVIAVLLVVVGPVVGIRSVFHKLRFSTIKGGKYSNSINQLYATISQVCYFTFMYSSTCFGRPHAHHQELNNCSSSLWFYRWSVVIAVLLVVVGPVVGNIQIQINQPTRCNNFSSLLLYVYVQLNMFRASSRPSSGAQQLQ